MPGPTALVLAHPDDEVIFGWPVLREADKLLICSSDLHNPKRPFGTRRKDALQCVCDLSGIEVECLDWPSEFYKLNERNGALEAFCQDVLNHIPDADVIFTHNPEGEYGHMDHKLVHDIVAHSGRAMQWSDMFVKTSWTPWDSLGEHAFRGMEHVATCEVDLDWYVDMQVEYARRRAWTWSCPPVTSCQVYQTARRPQDGIRQADRVGDNAAVQPVLPDV